MIDQTDMRLLTLLQANGRTPNAALARRLGMAPSAVLQRIRRLESRGVIQGYLARVNPDSVARGLVAFIHLRTEEPLGETRIAEEVARIPGVLEVHDVAGEDCYLVKARVADTDALHDLIRNGIGGVPGVLSTRTTIVLKTFAERFDLALPGEVPDTGET